MNTTIKAMYIPASCLNDIRHSVQARRPYGAYIVTKIPYLNFEISVSIKEEVGFREIRVYDQQDAGKDVTDNVFKDCGLYQLATAENLKIAMSWIENNQR
jgi:hypothetical protein